jgi:hypothetical protein
VLDKRRSVNVQTVRSASQGGLGLRVLRGAKARQPISLPSCYLVVAGTHGGADWGEVALAHFDTMSLDWMIVFLNGRRPGAHRDVDAAIRLSGPTGQDPAGVRTSVPPAAPVKRRSAHPQALATAADHELE